MTRSLPSPARRGIRRWSQRCCGNAASASASCPMRGRPDGPTVLERTAEGGTMNRLVIAARLLPGTHDRAEALLRKGPPFEPEAIGLHRPGAYLTPSEVVFVFEAPE